MASSKIQIVQRAAANTGNGLLVSLDDGSETADCVATHFDGRVEAMLTQHAWKFARRASPITQLSDTVESPWTAAWQAPTGMLALQYVVQTDSGLRVDHGERDLVSGKAILVLGAYEALTAVYTYRVTEDRFPGDFCLALQRYMEADMLRTINEQIDQADRREKAAMLLEQKARTRDQRSSTAGDANDWDLTTARRSSSRWLFRRA